MKHLLSMRTAWNWALSKVPDNLPTMLGISAGTAALSIGTTGIRGSKGAGSPHPELGDFITSGGVFSAERFQLRFHRIISTVKLCGVDFFQGIRVEETDALKPQGRDYELL